MATTLQRIHQRMTKEEREKSEQHARKERHKSCTSGMTNAQFAQSDQGFKTACSKAEVEPTRRQASKYRMGYGKAYAQR